MRLISVKNTPGMIDFGLIYGLIALLALAAARFLPVLSLAPRCVFMAITGIPCPTCGSTRSIEHFAHGRFVSAFALNPLAASGLFVLILVFLYSLVTILFDLPRMKVILKDREKDGLRITAVLLIFINWLYLLLAL